MKKLEPERIEWLLRRQARNARVEARRAGLSKRRLERHLAPRRRRTSIVRMPATILAEDPSKRMELTIVLTTVINALESSSDNVKLDFSAVKRMFPGGMLILVAYLELLLEAYPGRLRARCGPRSLPAQLLRHLGIADRLGVDPTVSQPTHQSVTRWRYLTGTVADGSPIARLIDEYRSLTGAQTPEGLFEALTEALTNVRQHAYPKDIDTTPDSMRRWWVFASYEGATGETPGRLYVGVYDIGVGIQRTLRAKLSPGEKLLDTAGRWLDWGSLRDNLLDRLLLQAAVEPGRTSTGLSHRGNGLPEMRDFVLATSSGRLSIVSGSAQYTCASNPPTNVCVHSKTMALGTLIVWTIPLRMEKRT